MTAAKDRLVGALDPLFQAAGRAGHLALRLLKPWRVVRFGVLPYDRLGHLAGNTELFLRQRAAGKEDPEALYVMLSGPPANRHLLDLIRRRVLVIESRAVRSYYTRGLKPLIAGGPFHVPLARSDEYFDFNGAPPQLSFSTEEEARGRALIARLGIPAGAPFVCFHSRDRDYLESAQPGLDFDYHDYRDCALNNYLPAAEKLAAAGVYCVRMGASAKTPLPQARHPRIIDYAYEQRSDFGDLYLAARCKFFLGSTAGLVCVAYCFNVPVAAANFTPLGYAPWRPTDLFIPKTYRDRASGRLMPYSELVRRGADLWTDGTLYRAAGIEVVENSAEEIAELALEMNARGEGRWTPPPGDEARQRRFRALFPPGHRITGYPSRVGSQFLLAHEELLA